MLNIRVKEYEVRRASGNRPRKLATPLGPILTYSVTHHAELLHIPYKENEDKLNAICRHHGNKDNTR